MSATREITAQDTLFGAAPPCGITDGQVEVRLVPKEVAAQIIRDGHYSGSTCWASNFHVGVFAGGRIVGALQYGPLMNPLSASSIVEGSRPEQAIELNRMWLADESPENTASRAIAFSLRLLRRHRPQIVWVQSFADERCGKFGAVYQASGFIYCGEHTGTFYELDGEWFHKSSIGRTDSRGWGIGPKLTHFQRNLDRATPHTFRQFRYLRFLRPRWRRRLLLDELPYPKPDERRAA